uniref:Uncharacterized protein n=1 Tax=Arundo donax TaxID=35708 RepID=A0A0A9C9S3_ARUDO
MEDRSQESGATFGKLRDVYDLFLHIMQDHHWMIS